jgi:hypothetical protein
VILAVANNSQLRLMSDTETIVINTDAPPERIIALVGIINGGQQAIEMLKREQVVHYLCCSGES